MLSTALLLSQQGIDEVFMHWPFCYRQLQVLYNKEELPLTELCGAAACDLHPFK